MAKFSLFDPHDRLGPGYWLSLTPGVRRVEIEIGPGDGRFLADAAIADPSTLYVGFEVSQASIARIEKRGLPRNALVRRLDGRFVVESVLGDASIDAFHIYFPDPWWKKRHAKRRLFTEPFVAALARTLRPEGFVYVLTDVETRYLEIAEALGSGGFGLEPWERPASTAGQSSYERKYRAQGRRIWGARGRPPAAISRPLPRATPA